MCFKGKDVCRSGFCEIEEDLKAVTLDDGRVRLRGEAAMDTRRDKETFRTCAEEYMAARKNPFRKPAVV